MAHNTTHNTITNTHSHSHSQRQRSHHTHTTHALPCSLLSASALQQAQSQPVAPCSQHRHMLAYRMAHTFHAALNPADRPCGQHTLPQTEACVLSHLTKRPVNCAHACTAMIKLQCCARDTRAHHHGVLECMTYMMYVMQGRCGTRVDTSKAAMRCYAC